MRDLFGPEYRRRTVLLLACWLLGYSGLVYGVIGFLNLYLAGDLFVRGLLLNTLAEARRARGELAEAEALAREGVSCKDAFDDCRGVAALIETLAWIASDRRDPVRAAILLGCAQGLRDSMAIPILAPLVSGHEACAERTRALTGDRVFDRAYRSGMAMPMADAVDYALDRAKQKPPTAARTSMTALSRREMEVARLVAEGLSNREIASRLGAQEQRHDGPDHGRG